MQSWVVDSLSTVDHRDADIEAARRLINAALGALPVKEGEDNLRFVAEALELAVIDLIEDNNSSDLLVKTSGDAFQLFRVISWPDDSMEAAKFLLRTMCLGVLGDRNVEVSRLLKATPWPPLPITSESWGERTLATVLDAWLALLRKDGWADLDRVQSHVASLREHQREFEENYLKGYNPRSTSGKTAGWSLVVVYHLAQAANLLATYTTEGEVAGNFDIRQELEGQFDRAVAVAERAGLAELESLARMLAKVAQQLVDGCLWSITRGTPAQITSFVRQVISRGRQHPIFEFLPPQRHALNQVGLLGKGQRSVVISLPTSSGKTFIAEFRILQALNQFTLQQGWTVYLAPTRALVNQVYRRLRHDFQPMGIKVERVSPALEVDFVETAILTDNSPSTRFDVLVTTPEKFDLLVRGGWESKIGRPLTLIIVDEAHSLSAEERGIKLELLLSTINRECRDAQFLLLTPFIDNAAEIARWLDPQNNQDVTLSVDWQPNDRLIALSVARRKGGGDFSIDLQPVDTTRTLFVPDTLPLPGGDRPLGLTYSDVKSSPGKIAAATAQLLKDRGSVIVLANKVDETWNIANRFKLGVNHRSELHEDVLLVQRYLAEEFGHDFALVDLLSYGVGIHHSGLSDEVRELMEWLFERDLIQILVATTTIAQGVNFPISAVVMASHQYALPEPPFKMTMPPEDFWNLAGRAGRVDQDALGIIALACIDEGEAAELRKFVQWQSVALASTLTAMVDKALQEWSKLDLHDLVYSHPEWSAFLQFLAHTYRQIGNSKTSAHQMEQILRGTLGFQALRRNRPEWAHLLIEGVNTYARRLKNKPLSLVDSTGWSWDSIADTMDKLNEEDIDPGVWNPVTLFGEDTQDLRKLMGILLAVPELRENLEEATGGDAPDGTKLARMIRDWVNGATLPEMAREYFGKNRKNQPVDSTKALTDCCRRLFGRLTQTASWGLAALQTLTLGDTSQHISEQERQTIRNLPSLVYYGVATNEAVSIRLAGAPRGAAQPLANWFGSDITSLSLPQIRAVLADGNGAIWSHVLGDAGPVYYRVWQTLYGGIG